MSNFAQKQEELFIERSGGFWNLRILETSAGLAVELIISYVRPQLQRWSQVSLNAGTSRTDSRKPSRTRQVQPGEKRLVSSTLIALRLQMTGQSVGGEALAVTAAEMLCGEGAFGALGLARHFVRTSTRLPLPRHQSISVGAR